MVLETAHVLCAFRVLGAKGEAHPFDSSKGDRLVLQYEKMYILRISDFFNEPWLRCIGAASRSVRNKAFEAVLPCNGEAPTGGCMDRSINMCVFTVRICTTLRYDSASIDWHYAYTIIKSL